MADFVPTEVSSVKSAQWIGEPIITPTNMTNNQLDVKQGKEQPELSKALLHEKISGILRIDDWDAGRIVRKKLYFEALKLAWPQFDGDHNSKEFQFIDVKILRENEIRKFAVEKLPETNRPATGEASVSREQF